MLFAHSHWLFKLGIVFAIPSSRGEGHILCANLRNKTFFGSLLSQFLQIFYPTGLVCTKTIIPLSVCGLLMDVYLAASYAYAWDSNFRCQILLYLDNFILERKTGVMVSSSEKRMLLSLLCIMLVGNKPTLNGLLFFYKFPRALLVS